MDISDKIRNAFGRVKSGTIAVSLEAKKKIRESSLKGEINSLEARLSSAYTRIGREGFASYHDVLYEYENLQKPMEDAQEIISQIEDKKKNWRRRCCGLTRRSLL